MFQILFSRSKSAHFAFRIAFDLAAKKIERSSISDDRLCKAEFSRTNFGISWKSNPEKFSSTLRVFSYGSIRTPSAPFHSAGFSLFCLRRKAIDQRKTARTSAITFDEVEVPYRKQHIFNILRLNSINFHFSYMWENMVVQTTESVGLSFVVVSPIISGFSFSNPLGGNIGKR